MVSCWDDFNSSLSIRGVLPDGLFFENNTVYGTPYQGKEITMYEVVSDADMQNPFKLYIGGTLHLFFSNCSVFITIDDRREHGGVIYHKRRLL